MLYCRTQLGQWDLIARDTISMTENSLQKLWTDCQVTFCQPKLEIKHFIYEHEFHNRTRTFLTL